MLSRTADHLYWLTRYLERAENLARVLDAANHLSLSGGVDAVSCWAPVLAISGGTEAYDRKYGAVNGIDVISHAVLDWSNGSGVLSCLKAARENAHAVRSVLPTELWQAINAMWLEARTLDGPALRQRGLIGFGEWVRERSQLVRGIALGTMRRGEPYHFMRLGTFLERADDIARILQVMDDRRDAEAARQLRWAGILRGFDALQPYRAAYGSDVVPSRVARLMILDAEQPRSLHFCMDIVHNHLETLCPPCEGTRLAGAIHSSLRFGRLEDLLADGLAPYCARFVADANRLCNQLHVDFLMAS
ncbi:MAG: alpha-E domain-containing protein [Magnetospirillum sp. WYHS-4]